MYPTYTLYNIGGCNEGQESVENEGGSLLYSSCYFILKPAGISEGPFYEAEEYEVLTV